MELILSFVLGIAVSWLFWRYLLFLAPKLHVCEKVVRAPSHKHPGKELLKLKVYNRTNRQAIDLFAGCTVAEIVDIPGGTRSRVLERLNVVSAPFDVLGPKENLGDHFGLSPVKVFTAQVSEAFDQHMAREAAKLIFTFKATDALGGSTTVIRRSFSRDDVQRGEFKYGLTCEIVSEPETNQEANKAMDSDEE